MMCVSRSNSYDNFEPRHQLAKKMLSQRFPVRSVVRVTHLDVAAIAELQSELLQDVLHDIQGMQVQGAEMTQAIRAEIMAA